MNKQRELSIDEAREKFLVHMWQLIEYWDSNDRARVSDGNGGWIHQGQRERLEGLLHSILASGFDGESLALPAMAVLPIVPKDDIKFHCGNGENWFPPNKDIGGGLNDLMYPVGRKHGFVK